MLNVRSFSHMSPRMRAEWRTLLTMIGRIAFSSKLPCAPAAATIESSPITCRQTITIASCWVGLTLPGVIDEPGSFAGSLSSCNPARGPEASQRMSLAIFISATARPRRPALTATIASSDPSAANLLGAVLNGLGWRSPEVRPASCEAIARPGGEQVHLERRLRRRLGGAGDLERGRDAARQRGQLVPALED